MTVAELIDILLNQDLDAEVIIKAGIEYPEFGTVKKAVPGVFKRSEYGNDFIDYEIFVVPGEVRAVLIEAQEEVDPSLANPNVFPSQDQ